MDYGLLPFLEENTLAEIDEDNNVIEGEIVVEEEDALP